MTDSLWNDIDTKLASVITASMGSGSSYSTGKVVTVQVVDQWTVDLRTSPAGDITLPCTFIVGRDWEPGNQDRVPPQGPHGDGIFHIDIAYPYDVVSATSPQLTYALALSGAKELSRRMREAIRANFALSGISSTDGEFVVDLTIGRSVIEVRGHDGSRFIGGALLPIKIYTQV